MSSRKHPLHTCAVSFFEIARKTSRKARDIDGTIGTLLRKSAIVASPIFFAAQYLVLATLVLVDSYILACEDNLGSLYPPSNRVFDKVDELVRIAETLPGHFDAFWDEHVVVLFDLLLSVLFSRGSEEYEERDVNIDENLMKSNEDPALEETGRVSNEDSTVEDTGRVGNEIGEIVEDESSSEVQVVDVSDKDEVGPMDQSEDGSVMSLDDNASLGNATDENGVVVAESNVKPSLAEEWFEAGWAVKPKQAAPKKKPKGKKKKN